MLRDHKAIYLDEGQSIIVEAVGDRYTTFEGYKDETGTRIGLSYAKLCTSVKAGNKILLADGSLSIQVNEILNGTELRGTVLNSKSLGERKNGNLPGVKVELPVLTDKDIDDLKNFAAKHKVDYVAASFVQVRRGSLSGPLRETEAVTFLCLNDKGVLLLFCSHAHTTLSIHTHFMHHTSMDRARPMWSSSDAFWTRPVASM